MDARFRIALLSDRFSKEIPGVAEGGAKGARAPHFSRRGAQPPNFHDKLILMM